MLKKALAITGTITGWLFTTAGIVVVIINRSSWEMAFWLLVMAMLIVAVTLISMILDYRDIIKENEKNALKTPDENSCFVDGYDDNRGGVIITSRSPMYRYGSIAAIYNTDGSTCRIGYGRLIYYDNMRQEFEVVKRLKGSDEVFKKLKELNVTCMKNTYVMPTVFIDDLAELSTIVTSSPPKP